MAVRGVLFATVVACLALAGSAWAGTIEFQGSAPTGQGTFSFTPGIGHALSIGAGGGGSGALVTQFLNSGTGMPLCGGDCSIVGGFLTLTTGGETSGSAGGGHFSYTFGSGGTLSITGEVPTLGINSPTVLFTASFLPGTTWSGTSSKGTLLGQINLASIVLVPQLGTYHYTGASTDDVGFNLVLGCGTGGVCKGLITQSGTTIQTIPEPASLSVLGVGLFVFGAGLRRRMDRAKPPVAA